MSLHTSCSSAAPSCFFLGQAYLHSAAPLSSSTLPSLPNTFESAQSDFVWGKTCNGDFFLQCSSVHEGAHARACVAHVHANDVTLVVGQQARSRPFWRFHALFLVQRVQCASAHRNPSTVPHLTTKKVQIPLCVADSRTQVVYAATPPQPSYAVSPGCAEDTPRTARRFPSTIQMCELTRKKDRFPYLAPLSRDKGRAGGSACGGCRCRLLRCVHEPGERDCLPSLCSTAKMDWQKFC
ncbi:hypothetical protein C8R45DRAFT_425479 [Mycena sanguinolenta]|nr:hypothetical protein C8R45DRAFT_425479 [Mycena sanguinolenta]